MAAEEVTRDQCALFSNCFEIKSKRHRATLTPHYIYWEPEGCPDFRHHVPLNEVVAIHAAESTRAGCCPCLYSREEGLLRTTELVSFHVTAFKLHYVERGWKHRWKMRTIVFHNPNSMVIQNWISTIQDAISNFRHRPRRLLIFINPFGGKKKAPKIYKQKIRPLFELAGIDTQVIVTERANHARDFLQDVCLAKVDGIVAVGGDGMFSELLNGILLKTQREKGININDVNRQLAQPELRIGIIPAGSTDAMAFSITGSNDPVSCALHIIIGDNISIDVCGIFHENRLLRYSTSMVAYGYFGDIMVDSEKYRWLGPYRYNWSGMKKVLRNRAYEGELLIRTNPKPETSPSDKAKCRTGCRTCEKAREAHLTSVGNDVLSKSDGWTCLRGRFLGVNTVTLSCACGMSKTGVSPSAHLGDGCTDVIIVKKCSRIDYLRFLFRIALHNEDPFSLNYVRVFRAREFQFRPVSLDEDDVENDINLGNPSINFEQRRPERQKKLHSSVWNCDGEILTEPAIHLKVYCQLIRVFARGVEASIFDTDFQTCQNSFKRVSNRLTT